MPSARAAELHLTVLPATPAIAEAALEPLDHSRRRAGHVLHELTDSDDLALALRTLDL